MSSHQRALISLDVHTTVSTLLDAMSNKDHEATCECIDCFRTNWLRINILKKYNPARGLRDDLNAITYAGLRATEDYGRKFNREPWTLDPVVTAVARQLIHNVMGPFSVGKIASYGRFSGGATTCGSRQVGHVSFKLDPLNSPPSLKKQTRKRRKLNMVLGQIVKAADRKEYESYRPVDVTPSAEKYAQAYCLSDRLLANSDASRCITISRGNHVDCVPKDETKNRTIAKEPAWNMFFQLAVGTYLKQRLYDVVGVDLTNQVTNQELAYEGSMHGMLATIDFRNASNTMYFKTVAKLLPYDWFIFLDEIRSREGFMPDTKEWVVYEMFSSMGNGFTFELESLIFWAVAQATIRVEGYRGDASVFGDDLIVPSDAAQTVIANLRDCGFETNSEKTFITGPFRESCGKHYYRGADVSHFQIKEPIDSLPRAIWLLNRIRWWSALGSDGEVCDPRTYPVWRDIYKMFSLRKVGTTDDLSSESLIVRPGFGKYRVLRTFPGARTIPDSFGLYYSKLWNSPKVKTLSKASTYWEDSGSLPSSMYYDDNGWRFLDVLRKSPATYRLEPYANKEILGIYARSFAYYPQEFSHETT